MTSTAHTPTTEGALNGTHSAAETGAEPETGPETRSDGIPTPTSTVDFRIITANIQSFPAEAMSDAQALEDLRENAEVADVVLLQEIAPRYRPLVAQAFPAAEWQVFFGADDNSEPIAFRTDLFTAIDKKATVLHPPVAKVHFRRHITHVHLKHKATGIAFHVTNLHMVAGAFSQPPHANRELRVREWNTGIAKHLNQVFSFAAAGEPVIGGGDYNRRLNAHPALGSEVDERPVKYAVDEKSIDLLWCVDGDTLRWNLVERQVFQGRDGKRPQRHSDHAARLAHVQLSGLGVAPEAGVPFLTIARIPAQGSAQPAKQGKAPKAPKAPKALKPLKKAAKKPAAKKAKPAVMREAWPPPFEKTTFGDTTKKTVDWKTRAALEEAERRLGYTLTIYQGSYNTTVKASAKTHWGGGVVDLAPWDHENKVRVLREIGFAAWYRPKSRSWDPHIHAVMIGHEKLHPQAADQVTQYRNGTDGLVSHAKDPTPRPHPIPVFHYPPKVRLEPLDPNGPHETPEGKGGAGPTSAKRPAQWRRAAAPGAAFPPRRTLDGVDTSHHQAGRIDLRKAQLAGLRFWYVKTTDGETTVDPTYKKRVREARRAGVPVGSYHFARPDGGDAEKEAVHFLKTSEIRLGDMVPMLDLEGHVVLQRDQLTRWVGVWVTTVQRALASKGLAATPIIYTSMDLDQSFGCKLWVARYSNDFREPRIPAPWTRAAIWQHSDGKIGPITNVPGFGHVDVNALHPDLPLNALRVKRLTASGGGNDVDALRNNLLIARKRIDDALAALPERKAR